MFAPPFTITFTSTLHLVVVRVVTLRGAVQVRIEVGAEYEEKLRETREELAAHARKARLREQMLEAVMSDEVTPES